MDTATPLEKAGIAICPAPQEGAMPPNALRVSRSRTLMLAICWGILFYLFVEPVAELAVYALDTELYSHLLMIPVISLYLVWTERENLRECPFIRKGTTCRVVLHVSLALLFIATSWACRRWQVELPTPDALVLRLVPLYCLSFAGLLLFTGTAVLRFVAFPIAFLIFALPFPDVVLEGLESFLQHASADASAILFGLTSTPFYREGLVFTFPGLAIRVAQECSGIRSTLVLFIVSFLAAHICFRTAWAKACFSVAVVPIAIVRNAIRIFTITMLTIHVDPQIIYSALHSRGGPLFFGLSLVPFFILLLLLRRIEQRRISAVAKHPPAAGHPAA
jgi:exosortase C (VPDSG-CTERM-specific)